MGIIYSLSHARKGKGLYYTEMVDRNRFVQMQGYNMYICRTKKKKKMKIFPECRQNITKETLFFSLDANEARESIRGMPTVNIHMKSAIF